MIIEGRDEVQAEREAEELLAEQPEFVLEDVPNIVDPTSIILEVLQQIEDLKE